jgi:hypothetical protein
MTFDRETKLGRSQAGLWTVARPVTCALPLDRKTTFARMRDDTRNRPTSDRETTLGRPELTFDRETTLGWPELTPERDDARGTGSRTQPSWARAADGLRHP